MLQMLELERGVMRNVFENCPADDSNKYMYYTEGKIRQQFSSPQKHNDSGHLVSILIMEQLEVEWLPSP